MLCFLKDKQETELQEIITRLENLEKVVSEIKFRLAWAGEPEKKYGPVKWPKEGKP